MLRASLEELSKLERKETNQLKLLELKKNSNCSVCGKKGHWRGDPECKAKRR